MKIATDTIIRTVVLLVALINQILTVAGYAPLPFDDQSAAELTATILTTASALWAWWKNNSFTRAALRGDAAMQAARLEQQEQSNDSVQ